MLTPMLAPLKGSEWIMAFSCRNYNSFSMFFFSLRLYLYIYYLWGLVYIQFPLLVNFLYEYLKKQFIFYKMQSYWEITSDSYLDFIKEYVVGIGPWKDTLVPVVNNYLQTPSDLVSRAHAHNLQVSIFCLNRVLSIVLCFVT